MKTTFRFNPACQEVWDLINSYPEQYFSRKLIQTNTSLTTTQTRQVIKELKKRKLIQVTKGKGVRANA